MSESTFDSGPRIEVLGRTLEKRSKLLSDFLREHGLENPKSVEYRPLAGCEPFNCFQNVEQQVLRAGGRMETGWAFRELIGVSIHTIAHAIWVTPQGKRLDITPWDFAPDRRILFLPEPRVSKKRGYTAGYRSIYTTDERVKAMERFEDSLHRIVDEHFVQMGDYMDIPESSFITAAAQAGIPWEVARLRVEHFCRNFGH